MSWFRGLWRRKRALAFHEELLQAFESAIAVEDDSRTLLHVNDKFLEMFRIPVTKKQIIGTNCAEMADQAKYSFLDPDYFTDRISRLLHAKQKVIGDLLYLQDRRCLERDYLPVFSRGEYVGHMWVYRDITTLHREAVTDKMTGLYNRRGLELFADQYLRLARRSPGFRLHLVFADINGLKVINDTHGHECGDELIRAAASVIRACFRESDVCARLGGDEFAVLAMGDGIDSAMLAARMSRIISDYNKTSPHPYELSLSFGISSWMGEDLYDLIRKADTKMYRCKERMKTEV